MNSPNTKLVTLAPGLRPERRFAPLARELYNYLVPLGTLRNLYPWLFSTSWQTAYLFYQGIFPFWAIHNVQILYTHEPDIMGPISHFRSLGSNVVPILHVIHMWVFRKGIIQASRVFCDNSSVSAGVLKIHTRLCFRLLTPPYI